MWRQWSMAARPRAGTLITETQRRTDSVNTHLLDYVRTDVCASASWRGRSRCPAAPIWRTRPMESWYICDDDNDDHIGPVVFDELVARTWEGSITPDARVYQARVTTGWQAARDVAVVGPLLEAVSAGRPSGCHWQRFRRRRADGTLWRHINRPQPFAVGGGVYF